MKSELTSVLIKISLIREKSIHLETVHNVSVSQYFIKYGFKEICVAFHGNTFPTLFTQ